jgi:hypothetical protein
MMMHKANVHLALELDPEAGSVFKLNAEGGAQLLNPLAGWQA